MSRILVTGGAGYVGSHIVKRLSEAGHDPVVVDDLSNGHRAAVGSAPLHVGDFSDPVILDELLPGVEVVVHMAAFCEVGESVTNPGMYYDNNVRRSLRLLEAARRHSTRGIVFSSTAAVYGEPRTPALDEDHPQLPTNPYGETKLTFERALAAYHRAYGQRYVALRYFNAAGAHPDGQIGEDHDPESHLIPRLIGSVSGGQAPTPIFGADYATRDGTCVRDYVHVTDLAEAHVLALEGLCTGAIEGEALNLGNGEGFTVREVVETVERVSGGKVPTRPAPRRAGDPATLVASSARAEARLGWKARYPDLESIVRTAWDWHREHPQGYTD